MKRFFLIFLAIAAVFCSRAQKHPFTIQDLYKVRSVYGFSLSPANDKLIMSQSSMNLAQHSSKSDIAIMDVKAKNPNLELKTEDGKSYQPVWDKDGL